MSLEKAARFDIGKKIDIQEQDAKDIDEILVSDQYIIVKKRYKDKEELGKSWKETVHFTAGYIQNNIERLGFDQVLAWDMYIIFLVDSDIDLSLACEIERDKYCCKKYVISTTGYQNDKAAISSRLPLFAALKDDAEMEHNAMNDRDIKNKITEGKDSYVSRYFREIDFVDDDIKCARLLEELEALYKKELSADEEN